MTFWDQKFGRNFLKMAAMFTMLIDHIGAVIVPVNHEAYLGLRILGRISFPLYCFLLVEGFYSTSNYRKYLLRLCLLGLVSEIPFNLAFHGSFFWIQRQNVFFTLALGLVVLKILERYKGDEIKQLLLVVVAGVLSFVLRMDYSFYGVLLIVVMNLFQQNLKKQFVLEGILFVLQGWIEAFAVLSIPFIMAYDCHKEEKPMAKWLGYGFYPLHLLILWSLSCYL